MDILELLKLSVQKNASDLHLSAGLPPMTRVDGDIQSLINDDRHNQILSHEDVYEMIISLMPEKQRHNYSTSLECDFTYEFKALEPFSSNDVRFRVNAFHQHRGAAAVLRLIPQNIITLKEINAPQILTDITKMKSGLILVTGATGSGKSTTLAAMIDEMNTKTASHIVTIEDPIEFVHHSKQSIIHQREVHTHTKDFTTALRSALREDPDVILVGELRDLETIRLALTAAETGHLVLATLHTQSAPKAVNRIIDVFPGSEKEMVRAMLSESLRAVISQTLVKKTSGGRMAAFEILIATPAIRHLIRENKIPQIPSVIQTNQSYGMQTLDQSLQQLIASEQILPEEASFKNIIQEPTYV